MSGDNSARASCAAIVGACLLPWSLGIFAALGVRWEIARWGLGVALLGLGLGCLRDRGKGVALLGCALALGGLAQGRRAAVLEIPARGPGDSAIRGRARSRAVDFWAIPPSPRLPSGWRGWRGRST